MAVKKKVRSTVTFATLEEGLDEVTVSNRHDYDEGAVVWWPKGFPWAVSTPDRGVTALFETETDALRWRLDYINRALNP